MNDLETLDLRHLWHPFTPAALWEQEEPLVIERGDGNYLYAQNGTPYFDGVSSLWTNVHGHNHPTINEAIHQQVKCIAHTTLLGLASPPSIELATVLSRIAPDGLQRVFYSDSGSTAVEIALKQSFQYWSLSGRPEKRSFVHLQHAYHGDTIGAVSVGGIDVFHATFGPLLFDAHTTLAPHPYRFEPTGEDIVSTCLADLATILEEHGDSIAALIVEPLVQGAGGILVHPPGYLRGAAELCRQNNVHLIVDEVATGFGRTGRLFACEHEDVQPDFLCLAKGITGGYLPLAATLATEEIYAAFRGTADAPSTFFHGHTYTGNPIACAAALANLRIFREEDVIAGLEEKEAVLSRALAPLAAHPNVGDIRQRGLMVGIELVADKAEQTSYAPEHRQGAAVCRAVREKQIIIRPLGDVIVLMPPLSSTRSELEHLATSVSWAIERTCQ